MAYLTVDFDQAIPGTPTGVGPLEPRATLILHGSLGLAWQVLAVVDTGATFVQLPTAAAQAIGLDLAGAANCLVMTAGGNTINLQQMQVEVSIEGQRVKVLANFGPGSPALVGREAIFVAMKTAGFKAPEWLIHW